VGTRVDSRDEVGRLNVESGGAEAEEEDVDDSKQQETLPEFLATRARKTSNARLGIDLVAASLTAAAIGVWRGPAWEIRLSIAAGLFAFAIWAIAQRELEQGAESPEALLTLRGVRVIAAVLGVAAVAFFMMALLGRALGRIIS
jgi:hypothetical protein